MTNTLKFVIAALALVAIFLGYKIYSLQTDSVVESSTDTDSQVSETEYTNTDVLKTPRIDSPESEKIGFSDLVRSKAVESSVLNISQCKADPIAIAVKAGSMLTLKNNDSVARTLSFGAEEVFKVEAKSTRSIKIDKQVDMIYAYGCDGSQGPIGMMLIK
jgi:hypothetical protein